MEGRFSKQNYFVKFTNPSHAIINGALPIKITNEFCFLNRPQRSELACRERKDEFLERQNQRSESRREHFRRLDPDSMLDKQVTDVLRPGDLLGF